MSDENPKRGDIGVLTRNEVKSSMVGKLERMPSRSVHVVIVLLGSILCAQSPPGWLKGRILDTAGSPIRGVQVYIVDSSVGDITDSTGYFVIGPLQPGSYEIIAQYIGYETSRSAGIELSAGTTAQVNLTLKEKAIPLEEIIVMPKQHEISAEGVTAVLTRKMIEDAPGAAQDVFLVLQTLPGISSTGDDSKLFVRGGRPEENLIIYDGATIRSPFHFDFVGGGFYSIFNTALIEKVTLFSGGFPARYGDRLSAVLVMENREGSRTERASEISLSMADLSMLVEFPLGLRGSSIMSFRRSYFDLLLNETGFGTDYTLLPYFYDFNGKIDLHLSARHRLSANVLYSYEDVSGYFDQPHWTGVHTWQSQSTTIGTRLRSLWTENVSSEVNFYWSGGRRDASHADGAGIEQVNEGELALKADLAYFDSKHEIHAGFWAVADQSDLKVFLPLDLAPNFEPVDLTGAGATPKYAAYLEDTFTFTSGDEVNLGIRADAVGKSGEVIISPRLGWNHEFRQDVIGTASLGLYTQAPPAYELDINPELFCRRSVAASAGLRGGDPSRFLWSVEAYLKNLDKLVTVSPSGALASKGTGSVKGIETYLQYQDSGRRFSGWLSITLSQAIRQEGTALEEVLFDYDQTLLLATVGQYRVGRLTTFSYRFRYTSGRPYTSAEGGIFDETYNRWFPIVSDRNEERLPAYHRLDLRFAHEFPDVGKGMNMYIETINTYNHNNVAYFIWDERFDGKDEFIIFPFLPVVGIELKL